jgi:SHS2 domain-containing protein
MDKKYEILEHPAELRLKIYGKTIEELFMNAAEAMADILATRDKRQAEKAKKENIKIQSADLDSLLVDFLSEILAKSQISKAVYLVSSIKYPAFADASAGRQASGGQAGLEVELTGYPVDHFDEDIKAVTYQDLNIQKINDIWQTEIVFDI